MRQIHRAGEKVFIDYAGPTIPVVDNRTGEVMFDAAVFVAVLGASNYTYVEADHKLYRTGCKAMFACLIILVEQPKP